MAPNSTIHIVRHAQGYHQVPLDKPNVHLRDPDLTPYGVEQCQKFCAAFPYHATTSLLCSSPMRRVIRTAMIAFEPEVKRGLRLVVLPDAQEASDVESDTGSEPEALKREFGDNIDYSNLTDSWYVKTGRNGILQATLEDRAASIRQWLWQREEKEIVLVTHGLFAHYITGNIDDSGNQTGEYWTNVRWRSFNFVLNDDGSRPVVETEESKRRVDEGHAKEHH